MPSLAKRVLWKLKKTAYAASGYYRHTGERVCAEFRDENFENHLKVYKFTSQFVQGKRVLDVGCGTGYGVDHLVAHGAASGVGIDYSAEAIRYAERHHGGPMKTFLEMDAHALEFPCDDFDVVVSTENLEHLQDPDRNISEIRRVLGNGGLLVLATPNKEMFSPGTEGTSNPFHIKEFYYEELASLVDRHFTEACIFENTAESPYELGRQLKAQRQKKGAVGIEQGSEAMHRIGTLDVRLAHLHNTHSFLVLAW